MRASHLEDFYSFLRFPSISTDDQYAEKLTECAHSLVKKLTSVGLETQLVPRMVIPSFGHVTSIDKGVARF